MRGEAGDELTLSVVNRSPSEAIDAEIRFADPFESRPATVERVVGPDPQAINSFESPDTVHVQREEARLADGETVRFPACSHTVITAGSGAGR
jgi:alpha-L-arabinofuranosidase